MRVIPRVLPATRDEIRDWNTVRDQWSGIEVIRDFLGN